MMKFFLTALASLLISYTLNAQVPQGGQGRNGNLTGRFYGKLVDSKTSKPVEYATVQLTQNRMDSATKKRKEVVVGGQLTRINGEFSIENLPVSGQYKLKATAIGYKTVEKTVSFERPANPGDMNAMLGAFDKDLGNIEMVIEEQVLSNVTVTATTPGLKLGIDRKVFNVDKDLTSAGGTAVDVMRNVPSVSVDIDGNVTMRNNAPQIFVDGRPTTMTLDQIPADAIESIEIITNPSAKFDASGGTSGILNVVLKKNRKVGYNGSIRMNIDSRGRFGIGGDINVRQNKINAFVGLNYNQRKSISTGTTNRYTFGIPNTFLHQDDRSEMNGNFRFLRTGIDYFMNNRNTISLTGHFGGGSFKPTSTSSMLTEFQNGPSSYTLAERLSNTTRDFRNMGSMLSYKHIFPKAGHELTADFNISRGRNWGSNLIKTDSLDLSTKTVEKTSSQRQDNSGTNYNYVFQADYTKPVTDKSKLEIGVRGSVRTTDSKNDFYFIYPGGTEIYNPLLSTDFNSTDQVYAGYTTYSNMIKNFGYQLGLRVESSDYEGHLPAKNENFRINFPVSLFPSVFLNQKMKNDQELQLNYSRRINRPNFWQLYPFTDYSDSLNISRGNPKLNPEFTNSIELSYQKTFKNKDNFLASVYYKNTNDLITRFQVKELNPVDSQDIIVNTYINANSSYVTGLEMILRSKLTKWWEMTSNLNLFTSKIDVDIPGQPEQDQFASWFGKINNSFKLYKNLTFQLSGEYQSRTVLPPGGSGGGGGGGGRGGGFGGMFGGASASQGYVRANYYVDAALRYEFLKNRQASISLNVNDIFRTRKSDVHSESPYFIQDVIRMRDAQVFRLNFNWRFGKFDASLFKRKSNRNNQPDDSENMNMMQ